MDPYGRLQMCQLSRRSFHDLRAGSFEEGWSSLFPALRARRWQTNAVCRRCSLLPLCGNCPGAAELEHGDVEAVVERFCEITHLQAFGVRDDVPGHRRDASCCLGAADAGALAPGPAARHASRLRRGAGAMLVRLRVAGLVLAARAPRPCRALALPGVLRRFAAARGEDIRLEVTEAPAPEPGPLLFESGGLWRVHQRGSRLLYLFHEPRPGAPLERALDIDPGLRRGALHLPAENWGAPAGFALGYPLDELLFQHRFVLEDALELHACGLVVAGRAVLLCGASGAGKTTSARLWRRLRPGVGVLSDDRIVVRPAGRGFRAHGTPWHGSGRFASGRSHPWPPSSSSATRPRAGRFDWTGARRPGSSSRARSRRRGTGAGPRPPSPPALGLLPVWPASRWASAPTPPQ